jgi:predicted membrane protein
MNEEQRPVRAGIIVGGAGGPVIAGLAIIALGVILLLDQEGILRAWDVWRFWPLILIIHGLVQMFRREAVPERLWGVAEILFGVVFQLDYLGYQHFQFRHTWPLVVIGAGLWIMYGAFRSEEKTSKWSHLDFRRVDVFGGGKVRVTSKNFRGGRWIAIFGGSQVDFTEAEPEGNEATLEILAIFGGGEITVPQNWEVVVRGVALFGGHNDETRRPLHEPAVPRKVLLITGAWVFGGFNIKN